MVNWCRIFGAKFLIEFYEELMEAGLEKKTVKLIAIYRNSILLVLILDGRLPPSTRSRKRRSKIDEEKHQQQQKKEKKWNEIVLQCSDIVPSTQRLRYTWRLVFMIALHCNLLNLLKFNVQSN